MAKVTPTRKSFGLSWPTYIFIGIVVFALVIFSLWISLDWSILEHIYSLKAGLDWFGIVFYHNYTFIAAALFSLLLINPRVGHSDLGSAISTVVGGFRMVRTSGSSDVPTYESVRLPHPGRRSWFLWQAVKWLVGFASFVATGGLPFIGDIMNPIMMLVQGLGDWSPIIRILALPLNPASGTELISLVPTMEIQYRVLYTVAFAVLSIISVRVVLRLLANPNARTVSVWGQGFVILAAAGIIVTILGAPYWLMNAATPYLYGILLTLLPGTIIGWAYLKATDRKAFQTTIPRKTLLKGLAALVVIGLVVQAGAMAFFYFNWDNNYLSYEWYPQTQKQITVTRWAAGIEKVNEGSLLNLPTSNASTTLGLVRQWDQQAAAVTMTKSIGAYNWMTLASSEIVFLKNKEYWVAPTSTAYPQTDWISEHLIYTHTTRIMVINTFSGQQVLTQQGFNVSTEPPIYYGESPLNPAEPGGFYQNVYVHVPGYSEIQNTSYQGQPDYTLTGWQKALWFTVAEGQLGFAFSGQYQSIDMLYNRDVFNRVQSILIPGLVEDPSAYLATDGSNIYYVIQLYIDSPLQTGFSGSDYLRFFGVVLVDVNDGSMRGYTVSNLIGNDSRDFLTKFYENYYPTWQAAPSWLVPQIRYPEQLLGSSDLGPGQIDYDFLYHVNDPFIWRSGTQFYERPANTSVQYIPWAIANQTYFVGMQLVNFQDSPSKNLAAMYIAYGGERLGQIDVYANPSPSTTFIGPTAAEEALQTNGQVRTQLTFLPNYRFGSYLLYSIGGRLTYFVAVYTNPGTSGVVTQLPFITAVDPTTGNVSLGSDAPLAYNNLVKPLTPPPVTDIHMLLSGIDSLTVLKGYSLLNVTSVNPTVWIRTGTISFGAAGLNATLAQVDSFLNAYGLGSLGSNVYVWTDNSGDLNVGVIRSGGSGVAQLYYLIITA
jgi:hypothetical protein